MLQRSTREEMGRALLGCVERSLSFLDESSVISVFWHLRNDFGIDKEGIASRPNEFVLALQDMFGEGFKLIEHKILAQACREFHIHPWKRPKTFPELVRDIKNQFTDY